MTKKTIAFLLIAMILISLTGCGKSVNFLGKDHKEEKNLVRSDEISIPIEKIRTLNPIVSKDEDAFYINQLIYEGLFGFDDTLGLVSVLAKDYTYGDNGYSVTIQLEKNIRWQDGQDLTAADVKFTIDAIVGASYANNTIYAANVKNIKSSKLDSKDPYEITIYFFTNTDIDMTNFVFPIVAKHQFKNLDAAKTATENFIPIGTGSYKVLSYNELSHLSLIGNDKYHGGNIPTNQLNFQIMPDKNDAINLMNVNNISVTFSKKIDRDTIYGDKDVNLTNFVSNELELLGFNFQNTALQDVRIRKAIGAAVNYDEIIESAYYKNGVKNDTIYYPGFLGVVSEQMTDSYDLSNGKKLLKDAGFMDRDGDGRVENLEGEPLTIRILVNNDNQSRVAAAQIVKEGLEQMAIGATVESVDWITYNASLASGNFDIFLGGYQINADFDMRFLLHTNYGNYIGYSNSKLDELLERMESGISPKERAEAFQKIQEILYSDIPYECLLYKTYGAIASTGFQGEIHSTFFDLYQGCENWYSMIEVKDETEETDSEAILTE